MFFYESAPFVVAFGNSSFVGHDNDGCCADLFTGKKSEICILDFCFYGNVVCEAFKCAVPVS